MFSLLLTSCRRDGQIHVDLESLLVLNVFRICDTKTISLKIVITEGIESMEHLFCVDLDHLAYEVVAIEQIDPITLCCVWPVLLTPQRVVSGLCSVSRQIVKHSGNDDGVRHLLGFRDSCLMTCNETSIWTRFCEIDLPKTVRNMMQVSTEFDGGDMLIPDDLLRLEYHLEQPVRMHNIYKLARKVNKDSALKSNVGIRDLNLHHTYAEGTAPYLSDILLYVSVDVLYTMFDSDLVNDALPLISNWRRAVRTLNYSFVRYQILTKPHCNISTVSINPAVRKESLYTSDPNRYKPQKRIYTKQSNIENVLAKVDLLFNIPVILESPYGLETDFDWSSLPIRANPESGSLPEKRAGRKCDQLANLARAVLKLVAGKSWRIVDFCSGSGHLGILVAYLLPQCSIILVENKEKSLDRARATIDALSLTNVTVLQSNLDYFKASFDVGLALHACGVASDLVLQHCVRARAHFVCCPCCYGGIRDCHHITYPRCVRFREAGISYDDYLNVAHAADQTHKANAKTEQGYKCMRIVDTDRKLWAESLGYEVHLSKMLPEDCSPKNHLLIGVCVDQDQAGNLSNLKSE